MVLKFTDLELENETFALLEDGSLTVELSQNKLILCDAVYAVTEPANHGEVSLNGSQITYSPKPDYFGHDRVAISGKCLFRSSGAVQLEFHINPVNDSPIVANRQINSNEDEVARIRLSARDVDNDPIEIIITSQPEFGTLSKASGDFLYTPGLDFSGKDRFYYAARDSESRSEIAEVHITVSEVNDLPEIMDMKLTGKYHTALRLIIKPEDPDDSEFNFVQVKKPKHGVISGELPNIYYIPKTGFLGEDRLEYQVSDGQSLSRIGTIDFRIEPLTRLGDLTGALNAKLVSGGVAAGNDKKPDLSINSKKYVPASLLKLATAAAAIDQLGETYRFQTEIYVSERRDLIVKGFGDPSLTTNEWKKIADGLKKRGLLGRSFRDLVLDDSSFEKNQDFDGRSKSINWFDAPLGPISTNQNVAKIVVLQDRSLRPWRDFAPITKTIIKSARGLPRGYQHLSIAKTPDEGTLYTGEIIKFIFEENGASFSGQIKIGNVSPNLNPVYIHESTRVLSQVVEEMLANSSNFIANQLLLTMAIDMYGEPVNLEMGVELLRGFLISEVGIRKRDFHIVEGSGLSRRNKMDLKAMLKLVNYFQIHQDLLPPLRKSRYIDLIKIGKKRSILAKTGTMRNVSTIAGYIFSKREKWVPFVIMLENGHKNRGELLEILAHYYQD